MKFNRWNLTIVCRGCLSSWKKINPSVITFFSLPRAGTNDCIYSLFLSNFDQCWRIYFVPIYANFPQNDNDNDNSSSRNAVEGRIVNLTDASDNPFIFQVRSNFLFRAGNTTTSLSIFGDNEADVTNTCALLFPLGTVGCCLTPPLLRHFLNRELAFEASSLRPDCIMSLSTYAQHPRSSTHEISSLDVVGETIAWRQFLENANKKGIASR